ncbi:Chemotaxis protein methyltransferase Cher2 [Planctomycetes bacterium Pan216]|uniref:protein-glutamate O-methyltransferase n=1 Tax=Kolteria novifilia TaxID=2527975 RepID=A0A518B2J9_9BACT|nr:Chemotaxis protein methyltransferase Cher2 [Planctomycetes bacterium Pan216]
MALSTSDFQALRDYIRRICGMSIPDGKEYLIEQRLGPIARKHGCADLSEFRNRMLGYDSFQLRDEVIDAITTRETCFFRDEHPFEALRELVLPRLTACAPTGQGGVDSEEKTVSVWCVASASGQEPYSLAMLIDEFAGSRHQGAGLNAFSILATDISNEAIRRARRGIYRRAEIERGLSAERIEAYVSRCDESYQICPRLRGHVEFRRCNLAEPFVTLGRFDLVLCRNVLIYFDPPMQRSVIEQIDLMLNPGGYLLLGAAESLYGVPVTLESLRHRDTILYRKPVAAT